MFRQAQIFVLMVVIGAGCSLFQETPQQRAQRIEPMLSASGFKTIPADTPEAMSHFQDLTPLKLSYYPQDGKPYYWFADPDYCQCLLMGDEQAYQAYERYLLEQNMQEQAEETAELEQAAAQQEQLNLMMYPVGPYFYPYGRYYYAY
jgi:hypothetical protein